MVEIKTILTLYWIHHCSFSCWQEKLSINGNSTELEKVVHAHWTSLQSGYLGGLGELNPIPQPLMFLLSQWILVLPPTFTSATVWTLVHTALTYLICDTPLLRTGWRFAPFQKLHRDQYSYVWTEALSGIKFFMLAQKLFSVVWMLQLIFYLR